MDWFVKAFIKAGLGWLVLGVTLGVAMAVHPPWAVYRTAHLHMNFLGFVTMMIYGVGYHVMPRFSGFPLKYRQLAGWQWWISNAGVALMVTGFILRGSPSTVIAGKVLLASGGVLAAFGAYAFAFNIWRTIDGPASQEKSTLPLAGNRPALPVGTAVRG